MPYQDFSQLSALTRRKRRPNRVSIINQQAQNLPELLELKGQREQREKLYGIEEEKLGLATTELASTTAYQNDLLKIQKKNAELAKDLGYANLGINVAFDLAKTETGKKIGSAAKSGLGWVYDKLFDLVT